MLTVSTHSLQGERETVKPERPWDSDNDHQLSIDHFLSLSPSTKFSCLAVPNNFHGNFWFTYQSASRALGLTVDYSLTRNRSDEKRCVVSTLSLRVNRAFAAIEYSTRKRSTFRPTAIVAIKTRTRDSNECALFNCSRVVSKWKTFESQICERLERDQRPIRERCRKSPTVRIVRTSMRIRVKTTGRCETGKQTVSCLSLRPYFKFQRSERLELIRQMYLRFR